MLTAEGIAAKEVLKALFFAEPRQWRLRKVLHIAPLTHDSYRARTSLQFLIQRAFFEAAWARAFRGTPNPPDPPSTEVEIVLPIDLLPKHVLLDFSLDGPDGKPLSLFTSGATSLITMEMFRLFTEELDDIVDDGLTTAQEFAAANHEVIACMIWTGQNDVARALDSYGWLSYDAPSADHFRQAMSVLYGGTAERVTVDAFLGCGFQERVALRCNDLYTAIGDLSAVLGAGRSGHPYWSPFRNPALLIGDFLRLRSVEVPQPAHVDEFIDLCLEFLRAMTILGADAERFGPITGFLEKLTREYVAYARVRVQLDRDFMIKIDQLIPMEVRWWQHYTGALRYQSYLISVGGSRSSHIEVSCEHPIELEQRPRRSRIVIGTRKLPVETIFSVGSHSTRYYQHFYTNRSAPEVRSLIQRHTGASEGSLRLRVYYRVEPGTMYGYRLISLLALTAAVLFARLYDPAKFSPAEPQLVSLIPFLSGFLGALSALRPQENVVAIRVRKHKLFVLALVGMITVHFLIGLAWPSWPQAVRDLVGRVPGIGSLVAPSD